MIAIDSFGCFFHLEKMTEVVHKLVENKIREQVILNLARELVQKSFLLIVINGLQLVIGPPEAEVGFDSLLQFWVNILAFVELFHETEKFG